MADYTNQKIKFLQGTKEKLKSLETSTLGAFYLTNDTNELYFGMDANSAPVALNRYVDIQEDWSAIQKIEAKEGKFYYAKKENILAIYDGSGWTQINPDTDTDTKVTGASFEKNENESTTEQLVYDLTLERKDIANNALSSVTTKLVIKPEDLTKIVTEVKVGQEATEITNGAKVSNVGLGADTETFIQLIEGDNVNISVSKDSNDDKISNITISSTDTNTTYDLLTENSDSQGTIVLKSSDNDSDTVNLKGDNNWIAVTSDDSGNVNISHTGPKEGKVVTTSTPATGSITDNQFTVATGVKADDKGHVTEVLTSTFTLPEVAEYTLDETLGEVRVTNVVDGESVTTTANYVDEIILKKDNANVDIIVDELTAHTITIDGVSKIIKNGDHIGDFYSDDKIEDLLKAVNAMVYKGVINSEDDVPKTAQIGWTYKVGTAGKYAEIDCSVGDILIANGEENEEGILTTINWEHIDQSDKEDTTYELIGKDNQIILKDKVTLAEDTISVEDDDVVILTVKDDVLKGEHKNYTPAEETLNETLDHSDTFVAITGISTEKGHVTGINTTTYTLPAEKPDTIEFDATNVKATFKNGSGALQGEIDFEDGTYLTAKGEQTGNVLKVSYEHNKTTRNDTTDTLSVAHEGTFNVVDSVTTNETGHVTAVNVRTITLPEDNNTTYDLSATNTTDVDNSVDISLTDNDGNKDTIQLTSTTLEVKADNDIVSVELVWGTF